MTGSAAEDGWFGVGERISAIVLSRRMPDWVDVRVGRRVAARMPRDLADRLGLEVGREWTTDLAETARQAAGESRARRAAEQLLLRRMVSRGELIDRLKRKGFSEGEAVSAAQRLEDLGLLNDEEYGRAVIRAQLAAKPAGPQLLRAQLRRRRLDPALIDRLLAEVEQNPVEDEQVARLIERKMRSMQGLDDSVKARRLYGLLARRGFDAESCRELVARALAGGRGDSGE